MNGRLAKQITKKVNKKAAQIKVQGLKEFMEFSAQQSFMRRFRISIKILFKKRIA